MFAVSESTIRLPWISNVTASTGLHWTKNQEVSDAGNVSYWNLLKNPSKEKNTHPIWSCKHSTVHHNFTFKFHIKKTNYRIRKTLEIIPTNLSKWQYKIWQYRSWQYWPWQYRSWQYWPLTILTLVILIWMP